MANILNPGRAIALLRAHMNSLLSIGVRGLSVLGGFIVSFLIGRMYGPAANGEYALINQTALFLSVVAACGLDLAATRKYSEAVAKGVPIARTSLLKLVGVSIAMVGVMGLFLVAGGDRLMHIMFKGDIPQGAITLVVLIMLSRTLLRILCAVMRSQKAYILGQSLEVLSLPVGVALIMLAGLATEVNALLWATAALGIAASAYALQYSIRFTSSGPEALDVSARIMMTIALPLWGVTIFLSVTDWFCLATASAMLGVYQAGLYRVAVQIGTISTFLTMGLFAVFMPQIGTAFARDDRAEIGRLCRSAFAIATLFTAPFAIVIFIFAPEILRMFGPEFEAATGALRILTAGQALFSITGHAGLVQAMTGQERLNFQQTALGTVALLILGPLGAHFGGLEGLSLAVGAVLTGRNILAFITVSRIMGINVVTGRVREDDHLAGISPA